VECSGNFEMVTNNGRYGPAKQKAVQAKSGRKLWIRQKGCSFLSLTSSSFFLVNIKINDAFLLIGCFI
jgi:hypothetical protein